MRYRIIIFLWLTLLSANNLLAASDYFFENDSPLYRTIRGDVSSVLFVKKSTNYFEIDNVRGNYQIVDVITSKALNKCSEIDKLCKISY